MEDMPRKLPLHVIRERTRHNRVVFYFRVGKGDRIRLLDDLNSDEFKEAYKAALMGNKRAFQSKSVSSQSFQWLVDRYLESGAWAALSPATRKQRGLILKDAIERTENANFILITSDVIEGGIDSRRSTPAQANNFLKAMTGLFQWAVKNKHVKINPCAGVSRLSYTTTGFPAWDATDAARFFAAYDVGTIPRLAFELLLQSGLRRSDVVHAGRQHLNGNIFTMRTRKTGAVISVEFSPRLLKIIAATKTGDLHFITNAHGEPFTKESFGNWFREKCRDAGIYKSAHGIRKLSATIAANSGATSHELMAQYGWATSKQAETYTRGADRIRLGISSSRKVAEQIEAISPAPQNPGAGKIKKTSMKSNAKK